MPALQWRHDHHQPGALLLLGQAGARHLRQYRRHQDIRGPLIAEGVEELFCGSEFVDFSKTTKIALQ